MSRSSNRHAASLARQATQLAIAVPQVLTHRLARLAAAGPSPSERDRREFARMVAEKPAAFGQAWLAMALQAAAAQQAFVLSMQRAALAPWLGAMPPAAGLAQWQGAALRALDKGLAPISRAAAANAARLGRSGRRPR